VISWRTTRFWDHHGERRIEASNQEVIAPEVREDDDVHLVMMHDGTGDDIVEGGGKDDGEDNERKRLLGGPVTPRRTGIAIEGSKRVK
jgi:hypothetical protein